MSRGLQWSDSGPDKGVAGTNLPMRLVHQSTAAFLTLGLLLPGVLFIVGAVASADSLKCGGQRSVSVTESDTDQALLFPGGGEISNVCESEETAARGCGPGSDYTAKHEKVYGSWGEVKRPGVVLPITTLFNAHTRESLPIFDAPKVKLSLLQHFFRCRGFGETVEMAPALLETVLAAARNFEATRTTIISGYRSPKFNDTLAKKGRRVATESRHMKGQAVDFRLDTVSADQLGPWLRSHFNGGVGTYRVDNFVHIDVGPKRSWEGH